MGRAAGTVPTRSREIARTSLPSLNVRFFLAAKPVPLLSQVHQFVPTQGVTERSLNLVHSRLRQNAYSTRQPGTTDCADIIKVRHTAVRETLGFAETDFHRYATDRGCDLGGQELVQ